MTRCGEFGRRNRAIYGDAMIARKIDLCGADARPRRPMMPLGMVAAGYHGDDHPGAPEWSWSPPWLQARQV
jgi:hypothetical protein